MAEYGEQYDEFSELLTMMGDIGLDLPQGRRLAELMRGDSNAQQLYLDFIRLHTLLVWQYGSKPEHGQNDDLSAVECRIECSESSVHPPFSPESDIQLAGVPPSAPSSYVPGFFSNTFHGAIGFFSQEIPFSLLVATVVTCLGLWFGSMFYVSRPTSVAKNPRPSIPSVAEPIPDRNTVGRITGMIDCKWSKGGREPSGFDSVPIGRQFMLDSGLLEITYNAGAKVILQGPVTYEVESRAGGFLALGKLTARLEGVKPQAVNSKSSLSTIHHPLFTIKTPTATVTDLGTEFGVEVSKEGRTTSHVFHGSVQVQAISSSGKSEGAVHVLHKNESAYVERQGIETSDGNRVTIVASSPLSPEFIREIPRPTIKNFDLVDVVAGGDGFSGHRCRGIDPSTGEIKSANLEDDVSRASPNLYLVGDGLYHRAKGLPFVDGVFIPDGRNGSFQVDSAGHKFAECPPTSNLVGHYIWAGGSIPTNAAPIQTRLGDVDYASAEHGLLFLHANKGITFDLDAIRKAYPDCTIQKFLAMTGNTGTGMADLWVLIDGKERFSRCRIINSYIRDAHRFTRLQRRPFPDVDRHGRRRWLFSGLDYLRRPASTNAVG